MYINDRGLQCTDSVTWISAALLHFTHTHTHIYTCIVYLHSDYLQVNFYELDVRL